MKARTFPEENYRSLHIGGKTMRFKIDPTKPIGELKFPEFYDVAINDRCWGRCEYCYADAKESGTDFDRPAEKIARYFGEGMTPNQRPFQVAIGGTGEPTMHPDFLEVLREFHIWGITPNFTTNGMFMANGGNDVVAAAQKYCGGVAVSCHKHLMPFWTTAVESFTDHGVKTNLHIIISDYNSIKDFVETYKAYSEKIDYFVLLPYSSIGRGKPRKVDWKNLKVALATMDMGKIAFGANFYPYLKDDGIGREISLYEPEIMSKFLSLRGNGALYKSSFSKEPVKGGLW